MLGHVENTEQVFNDGYPLSHSRVKYVDQNLTK